MPLADRILFLKNFVRRFPHTGAITASSRFLARAITDHVRPGHGPVKILEVGAGTGAFTRELVKLLRPGDQLVIYEINRDFAEVLRRRFGHHPQVQIVNRPIETIERKPAFDFIVAGVPLNNFPPELVREILETLRGVAKPGATASFFEYAFFRRLLKPFLSRAERDRLQRVAAVVAEFLRRHHIRSRFVLFNIPPAHARHLKFH
ncbi:MAG: methyltransferase domain-containing protein [Verrucomicrobia bacterium]|nr:methyltransferase domain-containing protein [Verrucomicrobiota bacterium]